MESADAVDVSLDVISVKRRIVMNQSSTDICISCSKERAGNEGRGRRGEI